MVDSRRWEPTDEFISQHFDGYGFYTKIAGVTFGRRQKAITHLQVGTPISIERQPTNEHDRNACLLLDYQRRELGYLSASVAAELAPEIDQGATWAAYVCDVDGGTKDRPTLGVNIWLGRVLTAGMRNARAIIAAADDEIEAAELAAARKDYPFAAKSYFTAIAAHLKAIELVPSHRAYYCSALHHLYARLSLQYERMGALAEAVATIEAAQKLGAEGTKADAEAMHKRRIRCLAKIG